MVANRLVKRACYGTVRRTARGTERGAVIFVVILVLSMLTAVGLFAARAAGLNQRLSGYSRQATQAAYVSEYGTLTMVDELSGDRKTIYLEEMTKGTELCQSLQYAADGGVGLPCYRVHMSELQDRFEEEGSEGKIFEPDGGSFGVVTNNQPVGDFVVEITDRGLAGRPVAGMDQGGVGPRFRYDQVTLSSTGQVRPGSNSSADPNDPVCSDPTEQLAAAVAGSRGMRSTVQVGPIPE